MAFNRYRYGIIVAQRLLKTHRLICFQKLQGDPSIVRKGTPQIFRFIFEIYKWDAIYLKKVLNY